MEVKSDKRSTLTDDQVVELRTNYALLRDSLQPDELPTEVEEYLAQKYGVTRITIGHITSGRTRKNVGGPLRPRPGRMRKAQRRGFTATITLVIKDPAGRVVNTIHVPEGHTYIAQPVATPVDDDDMEDDMEDVDTYGTTPEHADQPAPNTLENQHDR